jgi:peptide/nickel transport system permease protein
MRRRARRWVSAGGGLVLLVLLAAGLAPILAPHPPGLQDLARSQQPPAWVEGGSWENPLGTDHPGGTS